MRIIIAGLLLSLPFCSLAQSADAGSKKSIKISFHVTSVSYANDPDWCPIAKCSAKKFTVEGFVDSSSGTRIAYRLTCEEAYAMTPRPLLKTSCGNIHANNDYDARLFASGISFWPEEKYTPPPFHGIYEIVSEREVSRPAQ